MQVGKVYLVGAGPGDPKLLTLRAAEVLRSADVVLYDGLANLDLQDFLRTRFFGQKGRKATADPELADRLEMATKVDPDSSCQVAPEAIAYSSRESALSSGSPETGRTAWISVGKHGSQRIWKQSEINDAMVHHAKLGKTVVRLKGGDTGIFARTGEELERLVLESIPFEVVPGITAASAVAAYAGIPITHRDWASAVALVTGHSQPSDGGPESDEAFDWDSMAAFPGTIVIYMGVTTVGDWSRKLTSAGKSSETPVALVRRCSWPDQETILCTLGEAAERMTPASKFRPPVLVVIGPVAHLGQPFNWFQKRPLLGKSVLLCRPRDDSSGTVDQFESLGATVYSQPALVVEPPETWQALDIEIDRLSQYSWIVFSSRFGVRALLDRIHFVGKDLRVFGNSRLAGVGPSIREELARYQLRADLIAESPFGAKSVADGLLSICRNTQQAASDGSSTSSQNARFLLIGNNRTDPILGEMLKAGGFQSTSVVAYRTNAVPSPAPIIAEKLRLGGMDFSLATSPAIAQTLIDWFGTELTKTKLVTISPAVSLIFRSFGLSNILEAKEPSIAGIISAIRFDASLELDK